MNNLFLTIGASQGPIFCGDLDDLACKVAARQLFAGELRSHLGRNNINLRFLYCTDLMSETVSLNIYVTSANIREA